jgi:hypothetical protein
VPVHLATFRVPGPWKNKYCASKRVAKTTSSVTCSSTKATNRSLVMTSDELGREKFDENLVKFKNAQSTALTRCLPTAVFPRQMQNRAEFRAHASINKHRFGKRPLVRHLAFSSWPRWRGGDQSNLKYFRIRRIQVHNPAWFRTHLSM